MAINTFATKTTDEAFECMARMVPFVAEIERDVEILEAKKMFTGKQKEDKNEKESEGESRTVNSGDVMEAIMPLILAKHRHAIFGIVGVATDKTPEEVAAQPWKVTLGIIKSGVMNDLYDFFPFAIQLVAHA